MANILSILRILLTIPTLFFLFEGKRLVALVFFLVAAGTDVLDGYMARKLKQVSKLGKFLDPLADRILMISIFIAFFIRREMPAWGLLVLVRDALVTLKAFFILARYGKKFLERIPSPTSLGKTATFLQALTAIFLFIHLPFQNYLILVTAGISFLTGLSYIRKSTTSSPGGFEEK